MEPIEQRLAVLEEKIDKMSVTVTKLYRIFFWTAVITVLAIVIPLIGLVFVVPSFISNYTTELGGGSMQGL
jgi:type II secretory pathway component PulF